MTDSSMSSDVRFVKGFILFSTVLAGLFLLLGFIVFFGGWSSMGGTTDDEVFLQLLDVGQGAMPYFIASGVFFLLAEYKTVHSG